MNFVKQGIFSDYLRCHRKSYNVMSKMLILCILIIMATSLLYVPTLLIKKPHWMACLVKSWIFMEVQAAANVHVLVYTLVHLFSGLYG